MAGDRAAAADVGFAVPVGEDAAGLGEDHGKGAGIPRPHHGIDRGVDAAGGDERNAVAVAPTANLAAAAGDAHQGVGRACAFKILETSGGDERVAQACAPSHPRGNTTAHAGKVGAFPPSAGAAHRPQALAKRWERADSRHHLVAMLECDKRSKERHARSERDGAVDRIEDPTPTAGAGNLAVLLAEDGIGGKRGANAVAQQRFDLAVGGGHRRIVGLRLYDERVGLKMAHRDRASAVREIEHERDARIDGREVLHRPIVMAPRGGDGPGFFCEMHAGENFTRPRDRLRRMLRNRHTLTLCTGAALAMVVGASAVAGAVASESGRATDGQQWSFEFEQSAWTPAPTIDPARAAVSGLGGRLSQMADAGDEEAGTQRVRAYDMDASAWWSNAVGAVLSARVIDDAAPAGNQPVPQLMLTDLCAGWRVYQSPLASVDVLGGARVAAASDGGSDEGGGGAGRRGSGFADLGAYESTSAAIVGLRSKVEVARGCAISLRADVSPRTSGAGMAWSIGGGARVDVGGEWTLSVDAGWRTLDAALVDTLGGGGGSGRSRSDEAIGAVWVGLSKSF